MSRGNSPLRKAASQEQGDGGDGSRTKAEKPPKCSGKRVAAILMACVGGLLFWDAFLTSPDKRWLRPNNASQKFLEWVQLHPCLGFGALFLAHASSVMFIIPVGIPLMLGAGCIYEEVYGWSIGIMTGTIVSFFGTGMGSIMCFTLGRSFMREHARKWIRKYPLLDAVDAAVSEQGIRIMAMIFLILPLLPVGPVSYLSGTTSMALSSFVMAKVASLPLMTLIVSIGASTGTLLSDPTGSEAKIIEENKSLIVVGIFLSVLMITCISLYIRKELDKILERQKKGSSQKIEEEIQTPTPCTTEDAIELGLAKARFRRSDKAP